MRSGMQTAAAFLCMLLSDSNHSVLPIQINLFFVSWYNCMSFQTTRLVAFDILVLPTRGRPCDGPTCRLGMYYGGNCGRRSTMMW